MELLEHIEIEPATPARSAVIILHGLGADGHDFEPIIPELHLPDSSGIRFILPHAPMREVTINDGMEMRAWYDFIPHSETAGNDDIAESSGQLRAGFSQGGVIALHTGTRFEHRLAGMIAMSTYLHDFSATRSEMHDANLAVPILMAHGTQDPMIPIMRAATSRENLIQLGYDVRWVDYPMGHQVCMEEIEEISAFINEVLPI
jgi:phospholipase/carboxylesterase